MARKFFAKGTGGNLDRWIAGGIVVALVLIGLILWGPLRGFLRPTTVEKTEQPKKAEKKTEKKAEKKTGKKEKKKQKDNAVGEREEKALVAIVIDDLGQDEKQAREILSLPGRVTLAIMPGLGQSRKIAELAKQDNHEVLIHLPMEYRGKNGTPASGMLRSNMTPMEFLAIVSEDVASVPGAVGINNHEGSSLTENKEAMKFLMAELKARNLMFLDSLTSAKSVAYATAKEFGLKAAKRDVFLDNEGDNPAYIRGQLDELADIAREHGKAIGIGHPHPATISELRKWLAEADGQGIEIVPVSKLMQ
ncbi:MAG TPA: divergent polysaccharide deacetylase family protein [Nitrospirota bacterium]